MNSRLISRIFSGPLSGALDAVPGGSDTAAEIIIAAMEAGVFSVVPSYSGYYDADDNPARYGDSIARVENRGTGASDATQTTALDQPEFLSTGNEVDYGDGYLFCDGVSGSYASVPDAADLDGFGDFTLQIDDVTLPDWTPTSDVALMGKWSSNSWYLRVSPFTGLLVLYNGTSTATSTVAPAVSNGEEISIKVVRTGSDVLFYCDTGSGFAKLGDTVPIGAALVPSGTGDVHIGSLSASSWPLNGKIGRARIWSDATQTTNVLDIDFTSATDGATEITATTGQTVTINGGAKIINPPLVTPSAVAHFPGISGNYLSVPDAADLDGFGDFTLQVDDMQASDWTPAVDITPLGKYTGASKSFLVQLQSNGKFRLLLSTTGANDLVYEATIATGLADNATASIRVLRTGSDIEMYLDTGSGFSQLGATIAGVSTAMHSGTEGVSIGAFAGGVSGFFTGKIGRARIWSDATQTTNVLDINIPVDASENDTSFTATSGQTVTVNTSGTDPCRILEHSEAFYDGTNNEMDFTLDAPFVGRCLVATSNGSFVADVSLPSGANELSSVGISTYAVRNDLLRSKGVFLLAPGTDEVALMAALVSKGAVESFAGVTNLTGMFKDCHLTSFPLVDTSNVTNFSSSWNGNNLTSFPLIDTSSGLNFASAWYGADFTSFPLIDTSIGTSFVYAWAANSILTSFPLLDVSSGTAFAYALNGCSSLASFPAGFFDSWSATPSTNCLLETWGGCTSLSQQSVENILVSIAASGQNAPGSGPDITIDSDGSALTSAATTAIATLIGRGWSVIYNGVDQFSPIHASPYFWYEAGSGVEQTDTSEAEEGDDAAKWTDLSGNGNHLLQPTGSKQPVSYPLGNGTGYPHVQTHVTGDKHFDVAFVSTYEEMRFFSVFSIVGSPAANGRVFSMGAGVSDTNGESYIPAYNSGGDLVAYDSSGTCTHAGGMTGRIFHDVLIERGSQSSILNRGTAVTASAPLTISQFDNMSVGANWSADSNLITVNMEFILAVPASTTALNITHIQDYILANYGI